VIPPAKRPATGVTILPPDRTTAFAGAAVIVSSLYWRVPGSAHRHDGVPGNHLAAVPANDIRAEATRLILLCSAIRYSSIVRCIVRQSST